MITLTVLQLLNAVDTMQHLLSQQHKGKSAFAIRRLWRSIYPDVQTACAARDTLFTDENSIGNGSGRKLRPELLGAFIRDPLFSTVISIDCDPLTAEDLTEATISPVQLDMLGPLISD
jgi:hypothetical protein